MEVDIGGVERQGVAHATDEVVLELVLLQKMPSFVDIGDKFASGKEGGRDG